MALPRPADTAPREGLRELAGRARPVALAGERLLAVVPALAGLLPDPGLRRGSTLAVSGPAGAGVTSLALALVAGPSAAGSWCAAVGMAGSGSGLGLVAAAEAGVALERFPLVASPPPAEWATVVAALLDAFDVVLVWPPPHLRAVAARRLVARARERGVVLVAVGGGAFAAEGADVRLTVTRARWEGLGRGHGRLEARRVEVVASGRGAAARERRVWLWLPDRSGLPAPAAPIPSDAPAERVGERAG